MPAKVPSLTGGGLRPRVRICRGIGVVRNVQCFHVQHDRCVPNVKIVRDERYEADGFTGEQPLYAFVRMVKRQDQEAGDSGENKAVVDLPALNILCII